MVRRGLFGTFSAERRELAILPLGISRGGKPEPILGANQLFADVEFVDALTVETFIELFIMNALRQSKRATRKAETGNFTSNLAAPFCSVLIKSLLFFFRHPKESFSINMHVWEVLLKR